MIRSSKKTYSALFLILFLLAFFGLKLFSIQKSNWDYPSLLLLIIIVWGSIKAKILYSKLVITCTFFVLASCIYSSFHYGQALYMVVAHSYKYLSIMFFFYLIKIQLPAKEAERLLITVGVICCCCYILQWLIYPTILFQGADSNKASEIAYRVRIPGSICCYCLFFYGVNQILLRNKSQGILYTILGFVPILIMGFRSLLGLSLVAFFLMIPFVLKRSAKTILFGILGAASVFLVMQTSLVQSKMEEMENRTESGQTFGNEDYIRWREFDYYWYEQFKSPVEHIIGGGVPTDPSSQYAKSIYGYAYDHNLFWDDLGVVGLSMIIGIPAVLLLIIMYIICIWRCKDSQFQYIRFTLAIVLIGSLFTTAELYRDGNILLFTLFMYIEYKYHQEKHAQSIKHANFRKRHK